MRLRGAPIDTDCSGMELGGTTSDYALARGAVSRDFGLYAFENVQGALSGFEILASLHQVALPQLDHPSELLLLAVGDAVVQRFDL